MLATGTCHLILAARAKKLVDLRFGEPSEVFQFIQQYCPPHKLMSEADREYDGMDVVRPHPHIREQVLQEHTADSTSSGIALIDDPACDESDEGFGRSS